MEAGLREGNRRGWNESVATDNAVDIRKEREKGDAVRVRQ